MANEWPGVVCCLQHSEMWMIRLFHWLVESIGLLLMNMTYKGVRRRRGTLARADVAPSWGAATEGSGSRTCLSRAPLRSETDQSLVRFRRTSSYYLQIFFISKLMSNLQFQSFSWTLIGLQSFTAFQPLHLLLQLNPMSNVFYATLHYTTIQVIQ